MHMLIFLTKNLQLQSRTIYINSTQHELDDEISQLFSIPDVIKVELNL